MSTLDDLDAALRAHMAEEQPGQLVIGWALVASTTAEDDGLHHYDNINPEGQPAHHTVGLFRIGINNVLTTGSEDDQ